MNKLVKTVSKNNLYYEYLKSINGILQLTDRELELLTKLIEYDLELDSTPDVPKNVIDSKHRKRIEKELGITHDNLSRYIKKLKLNGIIVEGKVDGEVMVNKILIPEIIKDRIQLTIIFRINEEA